MNICVVTVPSNKTYGFDGVSDEEFKVFQKNVTRILNLTSVGYDEEFAPGTDCAADVWSDSDDWSIGWDGLGVGATPHNEGDEVVFLSEEFYSLQTKYDFFVEMTDEQVQHIAKEFQSTINKYDETPVNA